MRQRLHSIAARCGTLRLSCGQDETTAEQSPVQAL